VTIINGPQWHWPSWALVIFPHGASWLAGGVVLFFVILRCLQRLLFEWQRRKTLIELLDHAPAGTEIIQVDSICRARMKITVGASPEQGPTLTGDGT
jgi:hypothetical protein